MKQKYSLDFGKKRKSCIPMGCCYRWDGKHIFYQHNVPNGTKIKIANALYPVRDKILVEIKTTVHSLVPLGTKCAG